MMNTSLLIGKEAPDFKSTAIINGHKIEKNFSLKNFRGKYIVLFFYPKDFTFVCPTELHAFQDNIEKFESRDVQIIAVSTDSEYSHLAWTKISKKEGGIKGVNYPIVSDINKTISYNYGVLSGNLYIENNKLLSSCEQLIAYRGLFLIDKKSIIRYQVINDLPLGRSINETIRIIDSLKNFEKNGEVCPADWNKGKKSIKPDFNGIKKFFN